MALQELDLLLPAQRLKHLPDLVTPFPIDDLLAIFGYNHYTVLALPLHVGLTLPIFHDFSHVDVVGGACLAGLLEVRRLLNDCGHKLTLCSVAPATKGVFTIARLDERFEFAEDRFAALASLQMIG
jgi:hypothetical protein